MLENVPDWIKAVGLLLGGGGIWKFFGDYRKGRERKGVTRADEGKLDAESYKLRAEAKKIDEDANNVAVEYALKVAQRLSDQNDETRAELDKTQAELFKTRDEIQKVNENYRKTNILWKMCTESLDKIQADLALEKERVEEQKTLIATLKIEIEKEKK